MSNKNHNIVKIKISANNQFIGNIKTHGSELRGQERAKRIAKNKTVQLTTVCLLLEQMFS